MMAPDMDAENPWPATSQPAAPREPAPLPAPAGHPPRRTGLVIALVLSIVAAIAFAAAFGWYALARANWEAQNTALRAHIDELAATASSANTRIAELEAVESELATLKEEYSAAVNTGARSTEVVAELEQIIDAYDNCVDAQQEHFDVLRNADRYVASSIRESEQSIVEFCAQVHQSYLTFRAENG